VTLIALLTSIWLMEHLAMMETIAPLEIAVQTEYVLVLTTIVKEFVEMEL
jgi:hypothetical protein